MPAQRKLRVVERLARMGSLVAEGFGVLNGLALAAKLPRGDGVFGNATMARRVPGHIFHRVGYNAPRSVAKRGIVSCLVGLNNWIEGSRGQPTRIDSRMKCQASS